VKTSCWRIDPRARYGQSRYALIPVFDRDPVAIVLHSERFVGLITRTDLINHPSLNL